jgi:hypothetical protein
MRPFHCISVVALCLAVGCKSPEQKQAEREAKQAQQAAKRAEQEALAKAEMHKDVPTDSVLHKVALGMPESEVQTLLGPPTSTSSHITGKQFIPFNFAGKDSVRIVYHWKGVGRVEFSQGSWGQRNGAVLCIHNPAEP